MCVLCDRNAREADAEAEDHAKRAKYAKQRADRWRAMSKDPKYHGSDGR